jgi:hypothetical protein
MSASVDFSNTAVMCHLEDPEAPGREPRQEGALDPGTDIVEQQHSNVAIQHRS